jgi:hypothetical protein
LVFFLYSFCSCVPSISSDNTEYNFSLISFSVYLRRHFLCDPI